MSKVDAYAAYLEYLAIKKTYTSEYDYVKYQGKVSASRESFNKRKDKQHFYKLLTKFDWDIDLLRYYLIVKLLYYPDNWIGTLFPEGSLSSYDAEIGTPLYVDQLTYRYYTEITPLQVFVDELDSDNRVIMEHTLQELHNALNDTFSRKTYLIDDVYLHHVSPMFMFIVGYRMKKEVSEYWKYACERQNPFVGAFVNRLMECFRMFEYLGLFSDLTKDQITDRLRQRIKK